jgi:ATP-binding cassette subfamily C protein CydC
MEAIVALLRAVPPDGVRWTVGALLALAGAAAGLALFGLAGGAALGAGAGALGFLAFGRAALRWAERLTTHDATFRHLAALRLWLFRRAASVAPARFEAMRAGDLLNRMTADIDALDALHLRVLLPLLVGAAVLLATIGLLLAIDGTMALAVALGGLGAVLLVPLVGRQLGARPAADAVEATARLRERIVEGLHGQADLAVYQAVPAFTADAAVIARDLATAQRRIAGATGLAGALSGVAGQVAIAALLVIGLGLAGDAPVPVAAGVALLLAVALFDVLGPASGALVALGRVVAAARRLLALAPDPAPAGGSLPADTEIRFEDVAFGYDGRAPVLRGLDLTVRAGETVVIEGSSGIGKSTVTALLLRLLDPTRGRIRIGGADLAAVMPEAVWRRVAVLPQRFTLFAGTLRENLAVGDPAADDGRLRQALDAVALDQWQRGLPQGLDTWLGEGGAKLSGGQARRVALARTLLADPPIAILDEPTDGLDAATEARVVATLQSWRRGRTMIVISHRRALRAVADRVLALEDGVLHEAARE